MRRVIAVAAVVALSVLVPAGRSAAGGDDGQISYEEAVAIAASQLVSSEQNSSRPLTPEEMMDIFTRVTFCGTSNALAAVSGSGNRICVPVDSAGPDVAGLVLRARAELTIRFPGIQTSPPLGNPSFVQIPTWFWVPESEWRSLESTVSDRGLSVTVKATPVRVRWSTGDGAEVVCEGPGQPFDYDLTEEQQSSECSHTYTKTSAEQPGEKYHVTASMEWSASYTTSIGVSGQFEPIVVVGTADLRVGQIQAISGG